MRASQPDEHVMREFDQSCTTTASRCHGAYNVLLRHKVSGATGSPCALQAGQGSGQPYGCCQCPVCMELGLPVGKLTLLSKYVTPIGSPSCQCYKFGFRRSVKSEQGPCFDVVQSISDLGHTALQTSSLKIQSTVWYGASYPSTTHQYGQTSANHTFHVYAVDWTLQGWCTLSCD